jgi:4-aminobutyrate aminotransferase
MIVDEVQSGMGRTGKWWAIEHYDVQPDMLLAAKGIASGMPLGVCLARQPIMDWERGTHGNTFGGNPVSCAAALATLDLIEARYMENARVVGQYANDALQEIAARHSGIGEVRGIGLMIGVEFVTDRTSKEPAKTLSDLVVDFAFERGLLLLSCGRSVIRIAPPLSVTQDEIDEGLQIFEAALVAAEQELASS